MFVGIIPNDIHISSGTNDFDRAGIDYPVYKLRFIPNNP